MQDDRDGSDLWRKRMRRTAERLRLLDEGRFKPQIARIEECLRRDAEWNLEAALQSCARWRSGGACPS
jgi:hypothetical protein